MRARAIAIIRERARGLNTEHSALALPGYAIFETLRAWLDLELARGRLFLALPVAFGTGILIYFSAPDEPNLVVSLALAIGLMAIAYRVRNQFGLYLITAALAAISAGHATATLRTALVAHPVLAAETGTLTITGWIIGSEGRPSGDRLTLLVTAIAPAIERAPTRIRVTTRGPAQVQVGSSVKLRARLSPPADPVAPGAYNFARDAYFAGIGASGFVTGPVERVELGTAPSEVTRAAALDNIRRGIGERIRAAIPGVTGAIADALVTGRRDGITEDVNQALRASGTYHILSISGFHMALVAAFVFGVVRGLLAFIPSVTLNHPVKAYAAGVALAVSTGYLVISGAEVATQRSWIMIAIVLIGVALGRAALTLRTLALAALAVLIIAPESLLGPSFQMSFAATLALVSGYSLLRPWAERHANDGISIGRAVLALSQGVAGLAMSSMLASLATAPYAAHHFHVLQPYGIPGNVLGAPIIEFVVMPLEIFALLLWPLGWDRPIWSLAGSGIDLFLVVCKWVASWPGGVIPITGLTALSLLAMSVGILCLTLLSTPLRLAGIAFLGLGALAATPVTKPLIVIDGRGTTILARGPDGRFAVVSPHSNRFSIARLLEIDGDRREPNDPSLKSAVRCDEFGCAMPLHGGGRIAVSTHPEGLADDCREATLVIARAPPSQNCAAQLIDLAALAWTGAVQVQRDSKAPERLIATATYDATATRPWIPTKPSGTTLSLIRTAPTVTALPQPADAEPPDPDGD
ncbi:MAG: ComEC/Rec2 family competence protein [Alphaproteobacteria bacterium]